MTNVEYMEKYQTIIDVVDNYGGNLGNYEILLKDDKEFTDLEAPTITEKIAARLRAKHRFLAFAFIRGSDRKRYGKLIEELSNDYIKGECNYPTSIGSA